MPVKDRKAEQNAIRDIAYAIEAFYVRSEINDSSDIVVKIRENLEYERVFLEDQEKDWKKIRWLNDDRCEVSNRGIADRHLNLEVPSLTYSGSPAGAQLLPTGMSGPHALREKLPLQAQHHRAAHSDPHPIFHDIHTRGKSLAMGAKGEVAGEGRMRTDGLAWIGIFIIGLLL